MFTPLCLRGGNENDVTRGKHPVIGGRSMAQHVADADTSTIEKNPFHVQWVDQFSGKHAD